MPLMRAKIEVQSVEKLKGCEVLHSRPVCGSTPFGPQGESEDNTFARYTPDGRVELRITNPELLDKINPGDKFYVDFTKVEE